MCINFSFYMPIINEKVYILLIIFSSNFATLKKIKKKTPINILN